MGPVPTLNEAEERLVNALSPDSLVGGGSGDDLLPIRANVLRRLILQLPLRYRAAYADEATEQVVPVPTTGLRLQHLRIRGEQDLPGAAADESAILDVADAICSDGQPLPPLVLEQCVFPKAIIMSGASFRRLSLKGSRLLTLSADGMHIRGPVDLTGVRSVEGSERKPNTNFVPTDLSKPYTGAPRPRLVRPFAQPDEKAGSPPESSPDVESSRPRTVDMPQSLTVSHPGLSAAELPPTPETAEPNDQSFPIFDQQGQCWVQMRNCTIEDILDASGAEFVTPPLRAEAWDSTLARYAFNLAGTTIEGRLYCMSGFTAVGGLNIDNCHISGSVWLSGANVVAVERYALSATGAKIEQDLILDYASPIGELNAPFQAQGLVYLNRISVGGRFFMRCAELFADSADALLSQATRNSGLDAWGCRIGHDVAMTGPAVGKQPIHPDWLPFYCEGDINFRKAEIGGTLQMSGAMVDGDVSFIDATVGSDASFGPFSAKEGDKGWYFFANTLDFTNSTFERGIDLGGATICNRKNQQIALNMQSVTVKGSVNLSDAENLRLFIEGRVNLSWAQIHTELRLAPTIVLKEELPWDLEEEGKKAWKVLLSKVENEQKVSTMQGLKRAATDNLFARLAVDLEHADISGKLTVNVILRYRSNEGKLTSNSAQERAWADLTCCSIGELSDSYGYGWSPLRLGLNGVKLQRLPNTSYGALQLPESFPGEGRVVASLRAFSFAAKQLRDLDGSHGFVWHFVIAFIWMWNHTVTPLVDLLISAFSRSPHIKWLDYQYRNVKHPHVSEFNPAAYDLMARLLREDGHDLEARRIVSAKLRMERLTSSDFPSNILSWFYEKLFDYGLSGWRAISTCLICMAIGFAATQIAVRRHVLVLNVSTVNTVAYHTQQDAARIMGHKLADGAAETEVGMPHVASSATVQPGLISVPAASPSQSGGLAGSPHLAEIPCENHVDQYLFPVETFIPTLDFGQSKVCEISREPSAEGWRIARAVYVFLGWIFIPITVLAISGFLRRRAEGASEI